MELVSERVQCKVIFQWNPRVPLCRDISLFEYRPGFRVEHVDTSTVPTALALASVNSVIGSFHPADADVFLTGATMRTALGDDVAVKGEGAKRRDQVTRLQVNVFDYTEATKAYLEQLQSGIGEFILKIARRTVI